MKSMHHKPEKNSVEICKTLILQSLVLLEGNRLRKILCQDLLSQNDSVILLVVVQQDCLLRPNFIVS
ncbi:hypothetical protein CJP72_01485 [Citrobacter sp. NCU1]|nr:hypothetical protein [Citrobacter sp. NCU1]